MRTTAIVRAAPRIVHVVGRVRAGDLWNVLVETRAPFDERGTFAVVFGMDRKPRLGEAMRTAVVT